MFINSILKNTMVNGPGTRYTIWFQGCSIHCPGCGNEPMWEPSKGEVWTPERLLSDIHSSKGIDGISLTGGEPLDQYKEVLKFLKMAFPLYEVFLTSGYDYDEIETCFPGILNYVDILVDGPFVKELVDETTAWRGSTNQNIRLLTDRAQKYINYKSEFGAEIFLSGDKITITGFGIPEGLLN